ncbi:MAG: hypothetical protein J0H49_13865 [Acidobacteria bacterium]|nr:hypothetical protein [Acidobacteriota bacterium]
MPRVFGFGPFDAGFAQWIGLSIRAGFIGIGREADHLVRQAKAASRAERSAWVYRCVASCLLIIGQGAVLSLAGVRTDHPLTLITAWATIFLLPKPTPRIPLAVARALAMVFTMTNLAAFYDLAKATYPGVVDPYGRIAGWCGIAIWIALSIWVLASFRDPGRAATVASNGQTASATTERPSDIFRNASEDIDRTANIEPSGRPNLQLIRGGRDLGKLMKVPDDAE